MSVPIVDKKHIQRAFSLNYLPRSGRVYFIDKKIINIVVTYSIVVQKMEVKHVVFQ